MSPTEPRERGNRSRGGCYNCRIRKVKCKRLSQDGSRIVDEACQNCSRLRFECRWTAPAEGEDFTPPPKRRRTLRRASRTHGSHDPPPLNAVDPTLPVDALRGKEAGPSSRPIDAESNGDFDALWGDLFDLGNLPPVSMNWDEALDIVLPHSAINELPEVSPISIQPFTAAPQPTAGIDFQGLDWESNNYLFLMRHYLEVMKGYAKVEDRDRDSNNVYLSAFTRALSVPPLFNAILAYSASHLSLVDPSFTAQAVDLAGQAYRGILDLNHEEQLDEPEAILSAIFILVKREHMLGNDLTQYTVLVEIAAGIVERPAMLEAMRRDPKCFAKRIIQRLLLIDSRASLFRMTGGIFVERMRRIDPIADVFLHDEQSSSADLLRATLMRQKVGDFDRRLHRQLREGLVSSPPVHRTEIIALEREIRESLSAFDNFSPMDRASAVLDLETYNRYMVASLLHAALLYLYLIYPSPCDKIQMSVQRIMEMQLAVARDPSRSQSPGSIWPSSLFFAGIAAEDVIHQDWILGQFRRAESWGYNIGKARQLLEVVTARREEGVRHDLTVLMREVTGDFIL